MSDLTFVIGRVNGLCFQAQAEYYDALRAGMFSKECVDFVDVDGAPSCVNGKWLDTIYLSSPESRENTRVHDKALEEEHEEEKSWS